METLIKIFLFFGLMKLLEGIYKNHPVIAVVLLAIFLGMVADWVTRKKE